MASNRRRPRRTRERSQSKPFLSRTTTLYTAEAQDLYSRQFRRTAYDLVFISIVARLKGEPGLAREVEGEFQQWLRETTQAFKEEKERLEHLMHDAGLELEHIQYTEPMEVTAEITSPLAGRFFTLIEQLDTIIRYIDCLWVHGEIESGAKTQLMKDWPRKLQKVSNRIRNSANLARKRMRESGQDQEADQAAQAESGITLSEEERASSPDEEAELETEGEVSTS